MILKLNRVFLILHFIAIAMLIAFASSFKLVNLNNPTQTSGYILLACIICFLAILSLLLAATGSPINLKMQKFEVLFVLLIAYLTANRYFVHTFPPFSQNYNELLLLVVLYFSIRCFCRIEHHNFFFLAIVLGGIMQAVYGNLQLYGLCATNNSNFKITGNFFNPGPYAGYLASVIPIAAGVLLFYKPDSAATNSPKFHLKGQFFYLVSLTGLVAISLVIFVTLSRAAVLGAGAGLFTILALKFNWAEYIKNGKKSHKRTLWGIVILTAMLLVGGLFYLSKKKSADGRLFVWRNAIQLIKDQPLLGCGFDCFGVRYMDYQAKYFQEHPNADSELADNVTFAFNDPLELISENGIIGGVLCLLILFLLIKTIDFGNPVCMIAFSGFFSILFFSVFSYPSHILSIKLNLLVCIATFANLAQRNFDLQQGSSRINQTHSLAKVSLAVFFSLVLYFTFLQVRNIYTALNSWGSAEFAFVRGDYASALTYDKAAHAVLRADGEFLLKYGMTLLLAGKQSPALKILTEASHYSNSTFLQMNLGKTYKALGMIKDAENAYYRSWLMCPNRLYPPYLLTRLYVETGQLTKADSMAEKLLRMRVKVRSPATDEIRASMKAFIEHRHRGIDRDFLQAFK